MKIKDTSEKKRPLYRIAVAVLAVMMLCQIVGCDRETESFAVSENRVTSDISSAGSNKTLFQIEDQICTLAQARVYLVNYQNLYGKKYGINLMKQSERLPEFEEYIKNMTVTQMAQTMCMAELATEREIALSDKQSEQIRRSAAEYFQSLTPEEVEYFHATEESIQDMYINYALANLVYASLTDSVNEEVSDDEARIMQAKQIFVTSKDTADLLSEKLKNGEEFAVLADYNEADSQDLTFGRGELPEEIENAAFVLENGECSGCIETKQGFYFIYCVNKFDEELTAKNKEVIAQERREKAFDSVYDEYITGVSSNIDINAWNELLVNTNEQLTTDSFFTTFEKYWK
ncbi:MAG: peptidyl-prolyl cis-trans isomerase [Eubacterium sp.]|nr:peptidyl-prolyl cis-trans isomerase [Eubacterium sp.]